MGDLKDQESFEFIFNEFRTQSNSYIREIAIESIIKLRPKSLLKYKDDAYVYGQLCLYIIESGEILREKEIEVKIDTKEDKKRVKDVFISHASEDKQRIVEPLVNILESNNISCWYDKKDIGWGDSIVGKINEGLESSKYVIFIISQTFLDKEWTNIELDATLNMQISTGEKKVLPILVGNVQSYQLPPLLRGKKYIEWSHKGEIVNELKKILGREVDAQSSFANPFPMPMPKRKITQLDKDKFTKEVYQEIVEYFEKALKYLKAQDNRYKTDMTKVTTLKFVSTVYFDGEIKNQCKIWMGGTFGSNSITYYADSSGHIDISNDSTSNDWLFLEEDEDGLYLKGSGMMNMFQNEDKKLRNGQEAGEYFWKSFIQWF